MLFSSSTSEHLKLSIFAGRESTDHTYSKHKSLKLLFISGSKIGRCIICCRMTKRNIFLLLMFLPFLTTVNKDAGSQKTIGFQKTGSSLKPSKIPAIDATKQPQEHNEQIGRVCGPKNQTMVGRYKSGT
jgi:hypothetical protein